MYLHIINILYEKYEKQIEYTPPEPKDCWSFHHFKTGVSVSDRCGAMLPAQPESLYIVPPKAHFRIIGSEDGYVNTIIWFKADSKLMDKFDLPLFSPIELPDIEYISKLLMDMYEAHLSDMPIKEEFRNALLIMVFASLYRFCHIDKLGAAQKTGRDLTFTRMSILSSPGIDWSASSIAAYAHMSVARECLLRNIYACTLRKKSSRNVTVNQHIAQKTRGFGKAVPAEAPCHGYINTV